MLTFNILVGLLTCSVGKALGASRVIAVDVKSECLDLAVKMGADITVNPTQVSLGDEIMKLTNQNGVQRIVEASGHAPTLSQCLKWLRKGGKLGIVGIPKGEVKFENPLPGFKKNFFLMINIKFKIWFSNRLRFILSTEDEFFNLGKHVKI